MPRTTTTLNTPWGQRAALAPEEDELAPTRCRERPCGALLPHPTRPRRNRTMRAPPRQIQVALSFAIRAKGSDVKRSRRNTAAYSGPATHHAGGCHRQISAPKLSSLLCFVHHDDSKDTIEAGRITPVPKKMSPRTSRARGSSCRRYASCAATTKPLSGAARALRRWRPPIRAPPPRGGGAPCRRAGTMTFPPGQDRLDLAPARSSFAALPVRGLISPAHSPVPAQISGQQKTLQEKRSAATTGSSRAAPSKPQERIWPMDPC